MKLLIVQKRTFQREVEWRRREHDLMLLVCSQLVDYVFFKNRIAFLYRWPIHLVISYREVSRYSFQKPVKDRFIVSDILFKKQFIIMFLEPIVFRLSRIQLEQKKFNFEFQNLGQ